MLQSKKWLQSTKRSNIKNPLEIFEVRIQMPPLELKRGVSRPTSTSEELIICTRERPCGHLTVEKAHDSTADNRFLPKGQLLSCWSQVWSTPMLLAVDIFYLCLMCTQRCSTFRASSRSDKTSPSPPSGFHQAPFITSLHHCQLLTLFRNYKKD